MTTCRCCGQQTTTAESSAIWVDDALMACCNRAFQVAEYRAAHEVEVVHLAYAMATTDAFHPTLRQHAIIPADLLDEAERALAHTVSWSSRPQPRTSDDLRTLLARAMMRLRQRGGDAISLDDVLHTLIFSGADLNGARLFENCVSRAPRPQPLSQRDVVRTIAPAKSAIHEWRGFAAPLPQRPAMPALAPVLEPQAVPTPAPNAMTTDLLARLSRQEHQITALQARIETLVQLSAAQSATSAASAATTINAPAAAETSREEPTTPPSRKLSARMIRLVAAAADETDDAAASDTSDGETSTSSSKRTSKSRGKRGKDTLPLSDRIKRRSLKVPNAVAPRAPAKPVREPSLRLVPPVDDATADLDDDTADDANLEDDLDAENDSLNGGPRQKRFYLAMDDYILLAPSIGPSTAGRLMRSGINTVRDLLSCDPATVAERVKARHVTPERIKAWQAQARLVCTIPWLRGIHAQLLVGAGFSTVASIRAADQDALCVAVLRFAASRNGQSVLRSGSPPEIEKIVRWVEHASLAEVDRAA